ncbi:hypothetical protein [Streptomyces griseoluteus]|uniref:hypothetical protein n=1 Tax=Streptomyces griseoluteus TaxID=29306 RepID=UPI0037032AA4
MTFAGNGEAPVADGTPVADASFAPGETFKDPKAGITIHVVGAGLDGKYRVRVTRTHTAKGTAVAGPVGQTTAEPAPLAGHSLARPPARP